jgi:hypothetical protein
VNVGLFLDDLIVRGALRQDAGVYTCRATSEAGDATDTATALLAIPPQVRVSADRQMIGRGDTVVLECTVIAGAPVPTIKWLRNGREVTEFRYVRVDGGRLTIQGAQDADAGTYSCVAENIAGRVDGQVQIDVGSK